MVVQQFNTPILLVIFNRPATTQKVFDVIRELKPKHLFVAADGPHHGNMEDIEKCRASRAIFKQIDWPCELQIRFHEENLGCGRSPADAITWFFENVEQGIVLEDDIIAHPSFFSFCEELLLRFKDDERVAMISGINFLSPWKSKQSSYIFSYLGATPGWASWRRVWQNYDYHLRSWNNASMQKKISRVLAQRAVFACYSKEFDSLAKNPRDDVWDYQWFYTRLAIAGCSVVPTVNLVTNIGFGPDATHTTNSNNPHAHLQMNAMVFPLKHKEFKISRRYEKLLFDRILNPTKKSFFKRIRRVLKKIFEWWS